MKKGRKLTWYSCSVEQNSMKAKEARKGRGKQMKRKRELVEIGPHALRDAANCSIGITGVSRCFCSYSINNGFLLQAGVSWWFILHH